MDPTARRRRTARMAPLTVVGLVLAGLAVTGTTTPVGAQPGPVPGRILVAGRDGADVPLLGGANRRHHLTHLGVDILDVGDVNTALATYRSRPEVVWAEPDARLHAASAPNDPLYQAQWTLHPSSGSGAPSPWSLNWEPVHPAATGAGVTVAVLDTGYRTGGSDQPVALDTSRARNFVTPGAGTADDNGHGTFVTNVIGEATDNLTGAAGIAPAATIVPVKVLGADGTGDLTVVAQGIDYAVSIGAQVINLSLAGDQSATLCHSVAVASATAVVVAASGNDAASWTTKPISYPAACTGALSVGSVAIDGSRPDYANTGCQMSLVAPGGDDLHQVDPSNPQSDWILQQGYDAIPTDPTYGTFQYYEEKGTSFSSAQAAGEAALLVGAGASPSRARHLMLGTARPVSSAHFTPEYGAGSVDIAAALSALQSGANPEPPLRGYRVVSSAGRVAGLGDDCQIPAFQGQVSTALAQPVVGAASTVSGAGYWLVASDGGIFSFGDATFHGSTGAIRLNKAIVGMAATPSGHGYWLVASDGGIFSFGDAAFYGSTGAITLNKPIVGIAATPSGHGYWLVASDGGIFSFGDAAFYGSTGAITLNKPIVGMAATPSGHGYWLVASDGGIFAFGDAAFYGSTGAITLNKPIVGMAATPAGHGYWMVATDGGIFAFGDAGFYGSTGGRPLSAPVVGITPSSTGSGYLLAGADGTVYNFGDVPFFGSAGALGAKAVAITPEPWPGL